MKTSNFFRKVGIAIAGLMIVLGTSFTTKMDAPCSELYARILHYDRNTSVVLTIRAKELPAHLKHGDRIINMFYVYNENCGR